MGGRSLTLLGGGGSMKVRREEICKIYSTRKKESVKNLQMKEGKAEELDVTLV